MLEVGSLNFSTNRDLFSQFTEEFLSLPNFQRAWVKVAENKGSPGIDAQTIDDFSLNLNTNILELRNTVANSTYQPLPYKQVVVPAKTYFSSFSVCCRSPKILVELGVKLRV
ncbi:hypothetical protein ACE1CI_32920 [Aerosakkonemataceae cyanobacterium BLCC-F50]|uniref:Reverse transcriptase n=1 Tax=Floridaenema flaviceps BLCC-F50 TaxID=3153642 RepID=A0ABV4Y171_9CYAN